MNPSGPQEDRSKVPPPPPSYDQQVGVRTMASDMQSIQQSGGESPQSQILSANEVFRAPQQQQNPSPYSGTPVGEQYTPPVMPVPPMQDQFSQNQPSDQGVIIEPPTSHSPLKTIATVIGIIIVAAGVGYGVYYLVSSLNTTPSVPSVPALSSSLIPSEEPTPEPLESIPLTHNSLIVSPSKSEQLTLTAVALQDFKTALVAASAREKMLVGSVKDLSFVNEAGMPVSTDQLLASFFPTSAAQLSVLFEQDFTAWFYGDKTGGNKFGIIMGVRPEISSEQLTASLAFLENTPAELANMFIATVGAPEQVGGFKEGPIDAITVRYLAYSAANQNVFEYVPVRIAGKIYVVITTSYFQMSHILKLLAAEPLTVPPGM